MSVAEERGPVDTEQGSLDALYRSEAPRLLRRLARWTRSRDEAQDVVQEAFVRLAGVGAARLDDMQRPEAFLGRIARNLLKDKAKSSASRQPRLQLVGAEEASAPFDQQRHLEARDALRRLETAVLRLKPRTREIFLAHRLEGLSYAEIAQRTGLSVKGVEKQMSKAIARIDRLMDRS